MIHRILKFSLGHRGFVLLATVVLVVCGGWAARHLPMDAVPDLTPTQVQVNTEAPALAPEESERLVTFPLETELAGTPGVAEVRSLTRMGLSQLTLIFKDGTDIYRARQLIGERLQAAAEKIPAGLTPKLAPITTGLGEIFQYVLDYAPGATNKPPGRREQLMELKLAHEFTVKPLLRITPGVAEINAIGGYEKQIVVSPKPDKLRDANLTYEDLAAVLGENVENAGGGVIHRGAEQVIIRSVGRVQTLEEIAALPVKMGAGAAPICVRDVADVGIGAKVRTGAATENGEESLIGMAMMLSGENSRTVARRIAERIGEIQPRLPPGMELRPLYDRAELVDQTIGTVEKNLLEGAILVVVVLLALLGNWRATLIVAAAIPLSFLFGMTGMAQGGISGNLMSLGAIDFGLIIDGAVVMVENVIRQLAARQHDLGRALTAEERSETVLKASQEVASPMFFGVLIISIVYVPILSLTGIEGKMFHPMAVAVLLCLGGALALALTLVPVLCALLLRGRIAEGDNRAIRAAKALYQPVLRWALRRPWPVAGGAVVLLALAMFAFTRLGAVFVPRLDEGSLVAQVFRTNSISLETSLEMQKKTEKDLLAHVPEIERVFSRIGTSEVATDPMPASQSDFYIFYRPPSQWRKTNGEAIGKTELAEIVREEIEQAAPGQEALMAQPIEMRFNELLEGVRADLAVKIFGDDYDELERIAGEMKELLEKIPGAGEVEFEASGRVPMLELQVNRTALARHDAHAADVNQVVAAAIAGRTVGSVLEDNRRFDLVVRMAEERRDNLEELRNLPVRVGENGMLPLGKLADFKTTASVDPIRREDGQRRAAILVNLRGRDVEGFVREAKEKVKTEIKLPEGFYVEFGGAFENLQRARARLAIVVPAALALIFALVFMAVGTFRHSLVIYSGIPLAATGGVFALWLRGMPFSISAGIGFIALSGVAALNGLVMTSYLNQLRAQGKSVGEAITEGALTRLRPVLITALVASLGFVPMALGHGSGAEVQQPLATVVIGGILSSTFLTLILLPVLYQWAEQRSAGEPMGRREGA